MEDLPSNNQFDVEVSGLACAVRIVGVDEGVPEMFPEDLTTGRSSREAPRTDKPRTDDGAAADEGAFEAFSTVSEMASILSLRYCLCRFYERRVQK